MLIRVGTWPGTPMTNELIMVEESLTRPKDKFFVIYITSTIFSIATDYPWKSLTASVDYFQYLYPDFQPEIAFFLVVNLMVLLSAVFTISTVHLLPVFKRVAFTSVVFFCSLLFIPLLDIGIHNCTVDIGLAFGLTIVAVFCMGIAVGMQQASAFGLSGMLPSSYTQATSVGMSFASILTYSARIITKLVFKEERYGAISFLVIGVIMILIGAVCLIILRSSKFVKFYMDRADVNSNNESKVNNEIASNDIEMVSSSSVVTDESDTTELVQEVQCDTGGKSTKLSQLKKQLKWRFFVFKKIWKMLVVLFLAFFISLILYPSLLSEVQYCSIGDWTALVLLSSFGISDTIGRYLVLLPFKWKPNWLLIASVCRFILIPLILLSLVPSPTHPIVTPSATIWIGLFTIGLMGLTHGYFITQALTIGPTLVDPEHRELTGTMGLLSVFLGGCLASPVAYILYPLTRLDDYTPCLENYTATFSCMNT